jgi:hypothetical protein
MRSVKFSLLVALVLSVGLGFAYKTLGSGEPAKIKVLVVTGHDVMPAHDWRKTTDRIRAILEEGKIFEVRVSEDTGIFEASTLANYDVVVLNFGFWTCPDLSPAARAGLLRYVEGARVSFRSTSPAAPIRTGRSTWTSWEGSGRRMWGGTALVESSPSRSRTPRTPLPAV